MRGMIVASVLVFVVASGTHITTANAQDQNSRAEQADAEKRSAYYEQLRAFVPDYEEINADPAFLKWLDKVDPRWGVRRQVYLNNAFYSFNAWQTAFLFKLYKNEIDGYSWNLYGGNVAGDFFYVDMRSIAVVDGKLRKAWSKIDSTGNLKGTFSQAKHLMYFDCSKEIYSLIQYISYNSGGEIIQSNRYEKYVWKSPRPDTTSQDLLKIVCSYRIAKARGAL